MSEFKLSAPTTFPLPDGRIINLRPISLVRIRAAEEKVKKDLTAQGIKVTPPTYTPVIPNVAPGVQVNPIPYTAETISEAPPEVQEEYKEYLKTVRRIRDLTVGQILSTLILRGTSFDVPEDGWVEEHVMDGLVVPEDPKEKYVHYMLHEVLIPPAVAEACAYAIMMLSLEGSDSEVIDAFEASFLHKKRLRRRVRPPSDPEEPEEG